MRCKLSTSDLSTDDLSTVSASDLSDDDDDSAGNEEVCSSDGVSPSGLTYGGDVSLPDGTEATPSDDTTEVPSSESTEHMPKAVQAPWMTGNGEAGNFVEIATRGGIMEYAAILKQRKLAFYLLYNLIHRCLAYLVVGQRESDLHLLSKSYIELYLRNEGPSSSLLFRPASRPRGKSSHSGLNDMNFPFRGTDRCLSTPTPDSLYQRNYHGYVPTKVLKL